MGRLGTFVPRLAALTVVWLLATAALTYAAAQKSPSAPATAPTTATTTAAPTVLTVPDVRRQAYTFAKGSLTDAGFAWKVVGGVRGYASNTVVAQSPAPGTQVVDTGAPTISLTLEKSGSQLGVPEQVSSISGTAVKLAGLASAELHRTHVARTPVLKLKAKAKVKATPRVTAKAKPVTKTPTRTPANRPPAFVVPGARREPLNEMPLTQRADLLLAWLATHPAANDANVRRWLYQHAWIVDGAQMGWWHGKQALQTLIKADDRVWQIWGIGARSELIAKHALAEVEARQK